MKLNTLAEVERKYILSILKKTKGNRMRAHEILGISYRNLGYKIARYKEQKIKVPEPQ